MLRIKYLHKHYLLTCYCVLGSFFNSYVFYQALVVTGENVVFEAIVFMIWTTLSIGMCFKVNVLRYFALLFFGLVGGLLFFGSIFVLFIGVSNEAVASYFSHENMYDSARRMILGMLNLLAFFHLRSEETKFFFKGTEKRLLIHSIKE